MILSPPDGLLRPRRALLLLPVLLLSLTGPLSAQRAGSGVVRGEVRDSVGAGLERVEVVLRDSLDRPVAATVTDDRGRYVLVGLPAGGPYVLSAEHLGYATLRRDGIRLTAGDSRRIDLVLATRPVALPRLEVTTAADPLFGGSRTGAATVLEERVVMTTPTVERDVVALAALSPMVSVEGDRISAAGQNSRYNSLRIDGAISQDLFGLSPTGVPGGQANARPLPLDAIRQYAVIVAPFDVRQSGFTGALMNATTRTGGDEWRGSAFAYYRDAALSRTADDSDIIRTYGRGATDAFRTEAAGFTLGGPIGDARLFAAGEFELRRRPMPGFHIGEADQFRVGLALDSIHRMADMLETLGLEPGSARSYPLQNPLGNLFTRLDVPFDGGHDLSLRYNYISAEQDVSPNRLGFDHYGLSSAGSLIESRTHGLVGRLTSQLGDHTSNELTLNVQHTADATRTTTQPMVEVRLATVFQDTTLLVRDVRAGGDPLAHDNALDQTVVRVTDHLNHVLGDHLLTAGLEGSWFGIRRRFLPASRGIWRFGSLATLNANHPSSFERLVLLDGADPEVDFTIVQLGALAQDEWALGERLSLTLGLRVDWPLPLSTPERNPWLDSVAGLRTDRAPSSKPLLAPRVGVNWTPFEGGGTQVRGGVGVFTGLPPLAWIADAYAGTGLRTEYVICEGDLAVPNLRAETPPPGCPDGGGTRSRDVTFFDDSFRYPQDLRASLAIDQQLPWELVATLEGVFTRAIHQVSLEDLNLMPAQEDDLSQEEGYPQHIGDRPIFGEPQPMVGPFGPFEVRRRWDGYGRVIRIGNRSRNTALSVAAQLQRRFSDRLDLRLAYTYTRAIDTRSLLYPNTTLNYGLTPIAGDPADPLAERSSFDRPHRVLASAWTRLADWGTGLHASLLYIGQSGLPYSYVYGGDVNGDGYPGHGAVENADNDLLYVPAFPSDLDGGGWMSRVLMVQLAELDPCLRRAKGTILRRNSCRTPWSNRLDISLSQGLRLPFADVRLRTDLLNVLNFLNPDWGRVYTVPPTVPVFELSARGGCLSASLCNISNLLEGRYTGPRRLAEGARTPMAELPHVLSLPESQWRAQLGIELQLH